MRRVGDNDAGARDIRHRLAAAHRVLDAANASLDLRIAHGLLDLIAHLLLGHTKALVPRCTLDGIVDARPGDHDPPSFERQTVAGAKREWQTRKAHHRHGENLSLIHISEPTRQAEISYA